MPDLAALYDNLTDIQRQNIIEFWASSVEIDPNELEDDDPVALLKLAREIRQNWIEHRRKAVAEMIHRGHIEL